MAKDCSSNWRQGFTAAIQKSLKRQAQPSYQVHQQGDNTCFANYTLALQDYAYYQRKFLSWVVFSYANDSKIKHSIDHNHHTHCLQVIDLTCLSIRLHLSERVCLCLLAIGTHTDPPYFRTPPWALIPKTGQKQNFHICRACGFDAIKRRKESKRQMIKHMAKTIATRRNSYISVLKCTFPLCKILAFATDGHSASSAKSGSSL